MPEAYTRDVIESDIWKKRTEYSPAFFCVKTVVMEKILVKLINRMKSQDDEPEKKVSRVARHRYERPSIIKHSMQSKQHLREHVDSPQVMYANVLNDLLQTHNYYRARHSSPALTISQRLNHIAQKYAERLAATSKFEHSGNKLGNEAIGENLYMQWISQGRVPVSGREAAKNWYGEISSYSFKHPQYSETTGHFTQMVWQSTHKMGVGVALSRDGREVYIVANYYPAGNIINPGYFERNVLPVKY